MYTYITYNIPLLKPRCPLIEQMRDRNGYSPAIATATTKESHWMICDSSKSLDLLSVDGFHDNLIIKIKSFRYHNYNNEEDLNLSKIVI